jgi:hypothetical protein
MTKTAWYHLPNAAHISRVLAHVRANPQKWAAASDAASDATWAAARKAAWAAVYDTAWAAAWDACLALIAWDKAGELVDKTPQQLKALSDAGVHAATLLLPASIAMAGTGGDE